MGRALLMGIHDQSESLTSSSSPGNTSGLAKTSSSQSLRKMLKIRQLQKQKQGERAAISDNFPIDPPKTKCVQKIYHPNIDPQGNVSLNILREDWSPVLSLKSVLLELNFLFLELNPSDPLNKDAANTLIKNPSAFSRNVLQSMKGLYVDNEYFDWVI